MKLSQCSSKNTYNHLKFSSCMRIIFWIRCWKCANYLRFLEKVFIKFSLNHWCFQLRRLFSFSFTQFLVKNVFIFTFALPSLFLAEFWWRIMLAQRRITTSRWWMVENFYKREPNKLCRNGSHILLMKKYGETLFELRQLNVNRRFDRCPFSLVACGEKFFISKSDKFKYEEFSSPNG